MAPLDPEDPDDPCDPPDPPRRFRDTFRRLLVASQALDGAKRPCGASLSIPHAYALLELHAANASLTISELAERLNIDRTNVSRLCARMEEGGELERGRHPRDRRARALQLTARGAELAAHVDRSSATHYQRVVAALGDDAAQVLDALRLLEDALVQTQDPQQEPTP